MIKWITAENATLADVDGYYCLGFNELWSKPKVRVGHFDALDTDMRFKLIGGPYMELGPTHVAKLPQGPGNEKSGRSHLDGPVIMPPWRGD